MSTLSYHRPKTLAEALSLLKEGTPLAGGTFLISRRSDLVSLVDLQDLGLDGLMMSEDEVVLGAMARLQAIVEARGNIPDALAEACRLEAGLNLRNMATVGGTIAAGDGRSPLLTLLLALGTLVEGVPGDVHRSLADVLAQKERGQGMRLITAARFSIPADVRYEQVGRAPLDRPLVCAALCKSRAAKGDSAWRLALGGFGSAPLLLADVGKSLKKEGVGGVVAAAAAAYAAAGDAWASAEYRSHVAGILAGRLLKEMMD
jgi:putative selenate reductase FAD-binding subunit